MELRLPELGEGITDATVVNVPVKVGQSVRAGETVIEVETDKASMPIPATSEYCRWPATRRRASSRVASGSRPVRNCRDHRNAVSRWFKYA